ncbi:MAG: hypothetical protein WCD18_06160 [Thermosynechococcaceae cyanobacterium]
MFSKTTMRLMAGCFAAIGGTVLSVASAHAVTPLGLYQGQLTIYDSPNGTFTKTTCVKFNADGTFGDLIFGSLTSSQSGAWAATKVKKGRWQAMNITPFAISYNGIVTNTGELLADGIVIYLVGSKYKPSPVKLFNMKKVANCTAPKSLTLPGLTVPPGSPSQP